MNEEQSAVVNSLDAKPANFVGRLGGALQTLGVSAWQFLLFLYKHPEVDKQLLDDANAQDWIKLEQDAIAAWKAAHPA